MKQLASGKDPQSKTFFRTPRIDWPKLIPFIACTALVFSAVNYLSAALPDTLIYPFPLTHNQVLSGLYLFTSLLFLFFGYLYFWKGDSIFRYKKFLPIILGIFSALAAALLFIKNVGFFWLASLLILVVWVLLQILAMEAFAKYASARIMSMAFGYYFLVICIFSSGFSLLFLVLFKNFSRIWISAACALTGIILISKSPKLNLEKSEENIPPKRNSTLFFQFFIRFLFGLIAGFAWGIPEIELPALVRGQRAQDILFGVNSLYLFSLAFLGFFAWPSGIAQKYRDSDIMFLVSFLIGLIFYIIIKFFQENPFLTLLLLVFFLAFLSGLVVAACTSTAKRIQITEKKGAWMTGALLWNGFMLGRALAAFFL